MKNALVMIPLVVMLSACGSLLKDPYERRADEERERQEKYVEKAIDKAPSWMMKTPTSESAVFASGTSASGDYSMAFHKAKADAYGKICMAAGGTASQQTKIYRADTQTATSEMSEMVLRSSCKEVDLTGVEVKEKKIIPEGNRFRAYVLVVLPTGDANLLRKAKDAQRLHEIAAKRAPDALKELDR